MSKLTAAQVAGFVLALSGLAFGQVTVNVSVANGGALGNGTSNGPSISADGRYIAFYSDASNLVPGDTNTFRDVFVFDRLTSTIAKVSNDSAGNAGNQLSGGSMISADGRWIVYHSDASNLVAGDTNVARDAFMFDRQTAVTTRISVDSSGAQGNGASSGPAISSDGHFIAFYSDASNLVAGDTNAARDVFLRDMQLGTTIRVSVDSSGAQSNGKSEACVISADGRWVLFASDATNLVAGDTNATRDVFRYDRLTGTTVRVSVDSAGVQGNGISQVIETVGTVPNTSPINGVSSISADGRYVAFYSSATNLVPLDTNLARDVFVRDMQLGTTVRVSVATSGTQGNNDSSSPNMTPDGRYVAFYSDATNLVTGDTNLARDVFVRDLQTSTTTRVNVSTAGAQANGRCSFHAMSSDGRFIAFAADATNIVANDTNLVEDVFVRDLGAPSGAGFCFGDGTANACPCGNSSAVGAASGCLNSLGSGGKLVGVGSPSITADSLILQGSGMPNSSVLYFQGTSQAGAGAGIVFGDGLRCAGGAVIRLGIRNNTAGVSQYPVLGDLAVSVKGVNSPGSARTYQAWYRNAAAFCNPEVFNLTNGWALTWSL